MSKNRFKIVTAKLKTESLMFADMISISAVIGEPHYLGINQLLQHTKLNYH